MIARRYKAPGVVVPATPKHQDKQATNHCERRLNNGLMQSFRELFRVLQEKAIGIEEALDDIIGDDVPF